jgi:RNA-binding motif protein, X-linked 2
LPEDFTRKVLRTISCPAPLFERQTLAFESPQNLRRHHEVSLWPAIQANVSSVVREIDRINRKQLELNENSSWYVSFYHPLIYRHDDFKDSAYIYVGGIPYELTEGDIICVFSQYGEILDMNMPRDRETGKPKGFCFLKYDDQRSTVLAVDNFNGAQLLGRTLRVDHSRDYRQRTKRKKKHSDSESEESEVELDEEGKPRMKGFNVAPKGWLDPPVEVQEESEADSIEEGIDPDDPMREYLIEQRREERARKDRKREKKHRHHGHKDGKERKHRHRKIKESEE